MSIQISGLQQIRSGGQTGISADKIPDKCPRCHHAITPNQLNGYLQSSRSNAFVSYLCPNEKCDSLFVAQYVKGRYPNASDQLYALANTFPQDLQRQSFPEAVEKTSSDFVNFYNQAHKAEQHGLTDICGPGYRKALEFLIKDYLINKKGVPKERVALTNIGVCIKNENWITDSRLRQAAERAAWLGNDEVHYERLHPNHSVEDLKTLIKLTVHWIEGEILTESMVAEIPNRLSVSP